MTENHIIDDHQKRGWSWYILPICMIASIAYLVYLGNWQLERLAWKDGLVSRVEQNLANPPLSIAEIRAIMDEDGDIEYRPVLARGKFVHEFEQYYFSTHQGASGYFVYTPLIRADSSVVMVNRGFVPMVNKDASTRLPGQLAGELLVTGLARSAPLAKPNSFVPDNDVEKNIYFWKNLRQMFDQSGFEAGTELVPFFIDANDAANPGGLPVGGVTRLQFSNNHLQYALTWFGLAFSLLAVGLTFMFRRPNRNE